MGIGRPERESTFTGKSPEGLWKGGEEMPPDDHVEEFGAGHRQPESLWLYYNWGRKSLVSLCLLGTLGARP